MRQLGRSLLVGVAAVLAGYVVWDRTEAYRFQRDVQAIATRGEPIDLSSLERAPSTAEEQEAAQLYAAAAERARDTFERDSRFTRVDVDAVVGAVDVSDLEDTFRKDAPPLQLLDRATPLPFAGFGGAVDGPEWAASSGLQTLSQLACLRSDLLAYHGDGDGAAASLVAAVRLQRTLPDMVTQSFLLIRQFGSLRILLRHAAPSTAALAALQAAVGEIPDDDLIHRDLLLRRARFIEAQADGTAQRNVPALAAFLFHPFLARTQRLQLEQYSDVIVAARTPWPEKLGVLGALVESPGNRDGRTTTRRAIFGPPLDIAALSASPVNAGVRLALRRLMLTTMAIERYRRGHDGRPPADLPSLAPALLPALPVDPFSGAPFVYRASASDYLLYSVDRNRKDDGGQIYGVGSRNPMPLPAVRDLGIRVPLVPQRGAQ